MFFGPGPHLGGDMAATGDRMTGGPAAVAAERGAKLETVAGGAGITLVGRFAGRVANLANQVILARMLGPEAFGLYTVGWTILRIGGVVTALGLDQGVVAFGSPLRRKLGSDFKAVVEQSAFLAVVSGLSGAIALWIAAPVLANRVFDDPGLVAVLRLFAVGLAVYPARVVASATTRISQKMWYSTVTEDLLQPLLTSILLIVLIVAGYGLYAAVTVTVVSVWVSLIVALGFVGFLYRHSWGAAPTRRPQIRRLIAFSLPASLAGIFGIANLWADRLLIAGFLPAQAVGYYQAAAQVAMGFSMILASFGAIVGPMVAEFARHSERRDIETIYRASTKWATLLSLPLAVVLGLGSADVLGVLFGSDYRAAAAALTVLVVGQLVNVGTGPVGVVLVMTGRQREWLAISGSMFGLNLLLNVLLIPRMGMMGAAVSTSVALAGQFLLGVLYLRARLSVTPYSRSFFKLFPALAAGVVTWWATHIIGPPVLRVLAGTVAVVALVAAAYLVQGLDEEDRHWISVIRRAVRSAGRKRDGMEETWRR